MRICFVHDTIGDLGGAEANVRHAATGLQARGAKIAFLHGRGTGVGEDRFASLFDDRFDWTTNTTQALAEMRAWQPDVIYVHKLARLDILADLVSSQIPLVRMMHDHDMYCQRSSRYFPWNRKACTRTAGYGCLARCALVRNRDGRLPFKLAWPGLKLKELELCRQFDHSLVVTNFMQSELVKHGFDASCISILPPVPKAAPQAFVPTYAKPLVLYVGQLIRGKGVDFFVRALSRLTTANWEARIIGDGDQADDLKKLVTSLGVADRVTFTGWVDQESLIDAYQDARCGVVPSVWPEPIATIGLEYMQHAMPVIGYDSGGISDWLKDGENGRLIPARSIEVFAQAIDSIIGHPERARAMGQDGLAKARSWHDQEAYFDQLLNVLGQVADKKKAAVV